MNALLDAAQKLVQDRGFNDFSYRDLAESVGIRSASIHYHFPTKTDLGVALVARYRAGMEATVEGLTAEGLASRDELDRYMNILAEAIDRGHRRCVCGVLGAELSTLELPLRREVTGFFLDNEGYLSRLLERGVGAGEFKLLASPAVTGKALFAILQGGMLAACVFGQADRFLAVADFIRQSLEPHKT